MCCHAQFPYGGTDREGLARLARCKDEVCEAIPEMHSVGVSHDERFEEKTELESHESYTTGQITVMMPALLLCWDLR